MTSDKKTLDELERSLKELQRENNSARKEQKQKVLFTTIQKIMDRLQKENDMDTAVDCAELILNHEQGPGQLYALLSIEDMLNKDKTSFHGQMKVELDVLDAKTDGGLFILALIWKLLCSVFLVGVLVYCWLPSVYAGLLEGGYIVFPPLCAIVIAVIVFKKAFDSRFLKAWVAFALTSMFGVVGCYYLMTESGEVVPKVAVNVFRVIASAGIIYLLRRVLPDLIIYFEIVTDNFKIMKKRKNIQQTKEDLEARCFELRRRLDFWEDEIKYGDIVEQYFALMDGTDTVHTVDQKTRQELASRIMRLKWYYEGVSGRMSRIKDPV